MHDIMVSPLPKHCHLTAIFDVSPNNNVTSILSEPMMCLQSCHTGPALSSSFFDACGFLIMTYHNKAFPLLYGTSLTDISESLV